MKRSRLFAILALSLVVRATAECAISPGEAEAQKCEEKIATVQREVVGKYDEALNELQLALQKGADLEGAIAVRTERQRLAKEQALSERNFVGEPKALRALQAQTVAKMQELIAQLVQESLPRIIEYKKSLTIAGRLDEAVAMRTAIEKLQNSHVPIVRPEAGAIVPADTLLVAFSGDRTRADKTYKGQRISVRGVVGGFRPDPNDAKSYLVYLTGGSSAGWVQCNFGPDHRCREEKGAFNVVTLVISHKDEGAVRVQKGQVLDVRGVCEGLDESVRLSKCEIPR